MLAKHCKRRMRTQGNFYEGLCKILVHFVSRSPVRRSQAAVNLMALNRNQTKEEKKASAQKRVRARAMQASYKCETSVADVCVFVTYVMIYVTALDVTYVVRCVTYL